MQRSVNVSCCNQFTIHGSDVMIFCEYSIMECNNDSANAIYCLSFSNIYIYGKKYFNNELTFLGGQPFSEVTLDLDINVWLISLVIVNSLKTKVWTSSSLNSSDSEQLFSTMQSFSVPKQIAHISIFDRRH